MISSSGQTARTSLQVETLEPGSHIRLSSSTVRQPTNSFPGLTTTEIPSKPTMISIGSTPFARQVASSCSVIGREASEMSVSSLQNRLKPPPDPEMPTVTRTRG
jgi:hypothetical protein